MNIVDRGFVRISGELTLKRKPDLFLSHSSVDKDFAVKLSDALISIGIDVFLDAWELEAGDSLHRSLSVAIERSKYVAVVMSSSFIKSEWCIDELSEALAREKQSKTKHVIPILIENGAKLPFLNDRLYLDFSDKFFSGVTRIGQIIHVLSKYYTEKYISEKNPENIGEVGQILGKCGWNNKTYVDPYAMAQFIKRADELGLPYKFHDGLLTVSIKNLIDNLNAMKDIDAANILGRLYNRCDEHVDSKIIGSGSD